MRLRINKEYSLLGDNIVSINVFPTLIMKIFALTFLSIAYCVAHAQVQINEIMASNTRSFPDVVDFEDYPDWIELKNTGGSVASLDNYFLSDDPANPYKWSFPASASIPANGQLMIMADGYDAIPGQSFPRGYWPWRNFTTERYHTNFSLAAAGETLTLTQATGIS